MRPDVRVEKADNRSEAADDRNGDQLYSAEAGDADLYFTGMNCSQKSGIIAGPEFAADSM